MKSPVLSVIIVTYNNENHILYCLNALPWNVFPIEIFVIDNNSRDRTRDIIRGYKPQSENCSIQFICNKTNTAYAHGINQGFSKASGKYILILGPDTRLYPKSVKTMINRLRQNPDIGLVAPQLINSKGVIQPSCRRFPTYPDLLLELSGLPRLFPNRFKPAWKMTDFDHKTLREVDQPEASCLLTSRKVVNQVGLMDEQFSMFFNDVDWCRRFNKHKWKIIFDPSAKVEHVKGASVYANKIPMIWKSHQGFYRYFNKYPELKLQKLINPFLGLLLIVTALLRSILMITTNRKDRFM